MKLVQLNMPGKESSDLGISGKASDAEAFIVNHKYLQIIMSNYQVVLQLRSKHDEDVRVRC